MKYMTFEDAKARLVQQTSEYEEKLNVLYCIIEQLKELFKIVQNNIIKIEHNEKTTPEIAAIRFCGSHYTIGLESNQPTYKKASILLKKIIKEKEYEYGKIDMDDVGNIIFPGGNKIRLVDKEEFEEMVLNFFFTCVGKR